MKRIYDANATKTILTNVLPGDFKMVKDKNSNGYVFMNALYGIETDSIKDYIDQAMHHSSFEHFDYGLDYGYSQVKIPGIILSDVIYGDGYDIKITNDEEFADGKPTRMIYNSGLIDLDQYTISGSGINGLEYMRVDKTGSGVLLLNTNTTSTDAIINDTYTSYQLQLSDLIEQRNISGYNYGVEIQDYDHTQKYEVIQPMLAANIIRKYPMTKLVNLPKDGKSSNYSVKYLVDYYDPVTYYWDPESTPPTYKPIRPTRDTYLDGDVETYYRAALNNPSGSGIYDTEYLDLEFTPISGTLKVYDLDSLDDEGMMIEIDQAGTQLYKYDYNPAERINIEGGVDDSDILVYTYIGYSSGIPYEEGTNVPEGTIASGYKITSWDYVREEDGVENFDWVEYPNNDITNKIKLVNPESRYVVEYKHAIDKTHHGITTMNSDKYVKYYDQDHIYASVDLIDNRVRLDAKLSIENSTRRAVTFNGFDVRPGSTIQELELVGVIQKRDSTNTSKSINVTDNALIGKEDIVLPDITNIEKTRFIYNTENPLTFTPNGSTPKSAFIGNSIGQRIIPAVNGLSNSTYYPFYDPNLREDRILQTRFKVMTTKNSSFNIITSLTSDYSWRIDMVNGKLFIQDSISQFSTAESFLNPGDIVDIMVISAGAFNTKLQTQRFILLVSINNSFFKYIKLFENTSVTYDAFTTDQTLIYPNSNIDLDFITLYDRGTL